LALGLFTAAGARAAGPWYVATNGADSNAGTSWGVPFLTIINALTNAGTVVNEMIWVSNGTYTITDTISNSAAKACHIRAWSTNPADTVLYGPGTNDVVNIRGVYMDGSGSLLEGFTVTNFYYGGSSFNGAGVYCNAGLVSNCIIAGNTLTNAASGLGGGLYLAAGSTAMNCTVVGNLFLSPSAGYGGGGIAINGGRVTNCRILNNTAGKANAGLNIQGGGVFVNASGSRLDNSVIASNTVDYNGGGVAIKYGVMSNCQVFANTLNNNYGVPGVFVRAFGTVVIESCLISNNIGPGSGMLIEYVGAQTVLISRGVIVNNSGGGGLTCNNPVGPLTLRNCLIANNTNSSNCGISITGTNGLVENCTIVSNLSAGSGVNAGGMYASNGVRVVNSIIYHNLNAGGTSSNVYATADCTFSNSCTAPLSAVVGTANTDADPKFVAKDTGNFRLSARSPCINTGTNQNWMTNSFDLEGKKRMRYGTVDIGAYERIYDGSIYSVR